MGSSDQVTAVPAPRVSTGAYVNGTMLLAIAALVIAAAWFGTSIDMPVATLAAAVGLMLLHLLPVPIPRADDFELVQLDEAVLLPMLLLLEPPAPLLAVLVGVAAGQRLMRTPAIRLAFNTSQMVVGTLAAVLVVDALVGAAPGPTMEGMAAAAAGMAAMFAVNHLLIAGVLVRSTGMSARQALCDRLPTHAVIWASNVVAGLIFAVVAFHAPWLLGVMLLPLVALNRTYRTHLATARERLEGERLKEDFVATVSHELRTPLTAIKGMLETLRRDDIELPEPTREQLLTVMDEQTRRLERLVGDLLDMRRIDTGSPLVGTPGRVQLDELVSRTVRGFVAARPDARVEVSIPRDLAAFGDAARLEQVLMNLLDNAMRHGASDLGIEISSFRHGDRVSIAVRDYGMGIAVEEHERIFERFYVTPDSSTRHGGGIGVGLYMSRQLTEQMGGTLSVNSSVGEGSIFTLTIPAAAPIDTTAPAEP